MGSCLGAVPCCCGSGWSSTSCLKQTVRHETINSMIATGEFVHREQSISYKQLDLGTPWNIKSTFATLRCICRLKHPAPNNSVLQCSLHLPQVEWASCTAESFAKTQDSSNHLNHWGMGDTVILSICQALQKLFFPQVLHGLVVWRASAITGSAGLLQHRSPMAPNFENWR